MKNTIKKLLAGFVVLPILVSTGCNYDTRKMDTKEIAKYTDSELEQEILKYFPIVETNEEGVFAYTSIENRDALEDRSLVYDSIMGMINDNVDTSKLENIKKFYDLFTEGYTPYKFGVQRTDDGKMYYIAEVPDVLEFTSSKITFKDDVCYIRYELRLDPLELDDVMRRLSKIDKSINMTRTEDLSTLITIDLNSDKHSLTLDRSITDVPSTQEILDNMMEQNKTTVPIDLEEEFDYLFIDDEEEEYDYTETYIHPDEGYNVYFDPYYYELVLASPDDVMVDPVYTEVPDYVIEKFNMTLDEFEELPLISHTIYVDDTMDETMYTHIVTLGEHTNPDDYFNGVEELGVEMACYLRNMYLGYGYDRLATLNCYEFIYAITADIFNDNQTRIYTSVNEHQTFLGAEKFFTYNGLFEVAAYSCMTNNGANTTIYLPSIFDMDIVCSGWSDCGIELVANCDDGISKIYQHLSSGMILTVNTVDCTIEMDYSK